MSAKGKLGEEEIKRRLLAELPAWRLADGALRRTFRTYGWKGTLMAVNAIGHLAEAAWHHPELGVSYDRIDVALASHDAHGVTERDLRLATEIEKLIGWRPGLEDGPFSGTPQDPAHGYIRYE